MGELHLVLFPDGQRACLLRPLGGRLRLDWTYWILHWLSFSSISLLVNKACK